MTLKANEDSQKADELMFDREFAKELEQNNDSNSLNQMNENEDLNSLENGSSMGSPASNLSREGLQDEEEVSSPMVPLDEAIGQIVETVVNKLSTTLQSLVVTDRVLEARKTADEWKDVCRIMANNPELIQKMGFSKNEQPQKVFKRLNMDISDPSTTSLAQFLSTPMSGPIWTIMVAFEVNQNDPIFTKWWRKIQNDHKDSFTKLCKYMQALHHFNEMSEQLWTQMAINPTAWSIQKIIVYLTACGDWIRSANLDTYKWSEKYYRAAENLALSEKNGGSLFKILEDLWPAGLKGNQVHYNNNPFDKVNLVTLEDVNDVIIAPPMKNFKFDPAKVWPEEESEDIPKSEDTPKSNRRRRHFPNIKEEDDEEEEEEDTYPVPFHLQFKKRKMQ